ncbi:NUDIX hydrolase [Streptomyces caniscabiei]|uniref:NUDIX hydrolase n=1 Tax=Streptomyces caniscabiei TaxID=2746961 RepID=UPI0038D441D2
MPHSIRETARAIIVQDDRLLLIRRSRQNSEGSIDNWLSIPGGGLDPGETIKNTQMSQELLYNQQ